MADIIHARRVLGRPTAYRIWSTIVDAYTTGAVSRRTMLREMVFRHGTDSRERIIAMLDRATATGTSSRDETRRLDQWDVERCEDEQGRGCGGFHHAFEATSDGTCGVCGEGASDPAHTGRLRCSLAVREGRFRVKGVAGRGGAKGAAKP